MTLHSNNGPFHDAVFLISLCCVLQIFEWWYFKKYGTSFIEQVSLNHISPLLGGGDPPPVESNGTSSSNSSNTQNHTVPGNSAKGNYNYLSYTSVSLERATAYSLL